MSLNNRITRRQAIETTAKALAGVAGFNALSSLSTAEGLPNASGAALSQATSTDPKSTQNLRIATCRFPVSGRPAENAKYIRDFIHRAARQGAHLLHRSEASLSGTPGSDLPSFEHYDWGALRKETSGLRTLAKELKMWLVLGSSHFLDGHSRPTFSIKSLYLTCSIRS
jgi:hypothetical protein